MAEAKDFVVKFAVYIAFLFALTSGQVSAAEVLSSANDSKIIWTGRKPTGSHSGTLNIKSAEAKFKSEGLEAITITVDMKSLAVTDKMPSNWKTKLENHLKSRDFFDTEKYDTAKFVSKSVTAEGKSAYRCKGSLEIKGISQDIEVPISITAGASGKLLGTKFKIDRNRWNLKHMSKGSMDTAKALDSFIYDEIDLEATVSFLQEVAKLKPKPSK